MIAIIVLVGCVALRRRRKDGHERKIPEGEEKSVQHSSNYDESLVPPSTAMYSTGGLHPGSVELESPTSFNMKDRRSYLSYRAPGLQDGPAELSSEGTSGARES